MGEATALEKEPGLLLYFIVFTSMGYLSLVTPYLK